MKLMSNQRPGLPDSWTLNQNSRISRMSTQISGIRWNSSHIPLSSCSFCVPSWSWAKMRQSHSCGQSKAVVKHISAVCSFAQHGCLWGQGCEIRSPLELNSRILRIPLLFGEFSGIRPTTCVPAWSRPK